LKKVIAIAGPTASGKTALAISLAQKLNAEILSADSRQIFKELIIGVARPTEEELRQVPHHFIGNISIHQPYSAGQFAKDALLFLEKYFQKKEVLLVCGGTGLYLKALFEGIDRTAADEQIRQDLESKLASSGLPFLANELKEKDSDLASKTDLNNPRRVLRALEWLMAGKKNDSGSQWPENWELAQFAIDLPRPVLYEKINSRVDTMMKQGLWEEATSLFEFKHLNALQTVGYQEIFDALEGKWSRETAIEKIKQHTRNFAKRQITWFRKVDSLTWIPPGNQEDMVRFVFRSQGNATG
jgi:tRNA dimethylallyltransferase